MISTKSAHLIVAAATHEGMSGKNNEDRYAVSAYQMSETDPTPSLFAIVADGVGGHHAGEVAAEIAVETISHAVAGSNGANPQQVLDLAINQASQTIRAQSELDEAQKGMGSTCACAWIIGEQLFTATVGDSRIYLARSGTIRQLNIDHTWIQEAIEHGIIRPEQAKGHPRAHIIRRYIGSKSPVETDFRLKLHPSETDEQSIDNQGMRLQPGDRLLMCSDGLTDLVEDHEILSALNNGVSEQTLHGLIDLANERGGHDNITLVALEVPQAKETRQIPESQQKTSRAIPWLLLLGLGMIGIIVIGAIAGVAWFMTRSEPTPTPTPTLAVPVIIEPSATEFIPPTPTQTATDTPIPSPTDTATPKATLTPNPTNTMTPTTTGTATETATQTPEGTQPTDGPSGGSSP